jgi:HJR/Mrr/RecB family endonuclease
LRYPVLPIEQYESHFCEIVNELQNDPGQEFGSSDLERYLQDLSEGLVKETQTRLERITPSGSGISFEEVCRLLLTSAGYEIERKHQYDGEGGDVDFVLRRSDVSPFETEETLLFVQVKKHSGETGRESVQQVLQMMNQEPDASGCVITLADEFTDDARTLAENNGIALMDGPKACRLLIEQVVTGST